MKHDWKAEAGATLIGSMPHTDRDRAIDLMLQATPEIPVWPQLSRFQPEQMMIQYLEGLPGVRTIDGTPRIDTGHQGFQDDLLAFYEEYLAVESRSIPIETSRFALGEETGKTFFAFLEALRRRNTQCKAVKGQVVGPFTLLAGLKDQADRSILYDDRMGDVVVKHLAMKACWQIAHLKSFGCPVIIFLDEPALAGFGSSAFISVSRDQVLQLIEDIVQAIHGAGGLAGIHVCANTDWTLAYDSSIDIINFDAYNYFERFALYNEAFHRHIATGKTIAWGMVPTSDPGIVMRESAQNLARLWLDRIGQLVGERTSLKNILEHSLFTPSCGCSSLPGEAAEKVLSDTRTLSEILKENPREP